MKQTSPGQFDHLLRVTASLFRERGYHATSLNAISKKMGLKKGSLYHYITGKQQLLVMLLHKGMDLVLGEIEAIYASNLSPSEKLRSAIEAHIVKFVQYLDLAKIFLYEFRFLDSDVEKKSYMLKRKKYEEYFHLIVQEGIDKDKFKDVDVKITTFAILGMSNWISEWYRVDGPLSSQQIAQQFADLLIYGLARK